MLQVSKDGHIVLGSGRSFHRPLSSSIVSVPSLLMLPLRGILRLLLLRIVHTFASCLCSSWARTFVYPIKLILINCSMMVAGVSFFFVTSTRNGRGSQQVTTAGSGKRPSTVMFGGGIFASVSWDGLRNSPGFSGMSIAGLKWCVRLANDSLLFGGGRGGSIGRNVNG